jgi:hypothetical protein
MKIKRALHKTLTGGESPYPYYDKNGNQILKWYRIKHDEKEYTAIQCGKLNDTYLEKENVIYMSDANNKLTHAKPSDVEIIRNEDGVPRMDIITCENDLYYYNCDGDKLYFRDDTFDCDTDGSSDDSDDSNYSSDSNVLDSINSSCELDLDDVIEIHDSDDEHDATKYTSKRKHVNELDEIHNTTKYTSKRKHVNESCDDVIKKSKNQITLKRKQPCESLESSH